jgi:HTH-type transcriptional regulator/antitoxin HigA
VRNLAQLVSVTGRYSDRKFDSLIEDLKLLCKDAREIRLVPTMLADHGIRFVIVEHLPKTKLDGVSLWLDNHSPVIGLSMRYDRIDYFWFTLFHELIHIKNKDKDCVAIGLYESTGTTGKKPEIERRADSGASNALLARKAFDDFVNRKGGIYSNEDIIGFSLDNHIHPGILIGQIHHREQNWTHFNKFLVKVRSIITETALTDGWGMSLSV